MSEYDDWTDKQRLEYGAYRMVLQDGKCWYCGCDIGGGNMELDHAISRANGGLSIKENARAACKECNRLKWDRDEDEFFQDARDVELEVLNELGNTNRVKRTKEENEKRRRYLEIAMNSRNR